MSSQLPLFKSQWSWVKESLSSNILWALPENCRRSTDPPKRATGVLRHGFIAGICSPAALIFQEFSCSFSWLLQAHWGNSQEKPRDINISYYLILNPTAFCSSHYGFTHFLGCKLEESLRSMNQPLCNYVYVTSDVQRFRLLLCCNAAVIAQGAGVHCGMVSAGVSLLHAQWPRYHLLVHSLSQLWWRRLD